MPYYLCVLRHSISRIPELLSFGWDTTTPHMHTKPCSCPAEMLCFVLRNMKRLSPYYSTELYKLLYHFLCNLKRALIKFWDKYNYYHNSKSALYIGQAGRRGHYCEYNQLLKSKNKCSTREKLFLSGDLVRYRKSLNAQARTFRLPSVGSGFGLDDHCGFLPI